eukprot:5664372-Pleurochrysis_carterae.AAC.2
MATAAAGGRGGGGLARATGSRGTPAAVECRGATGAAGALRGDGRGGYTGGHYRRQRGRRGRGLRFSHRRPRLLHGVASDGDMAR